MRSRPPKGEMMSRMRDFRGDAPESGELGALDRELREIEIEERCSFGPELRSHLASEYRQLRNGAGRNRLLYRRVAIAAGVVVALTGTALAVAPARDGFLNRLGFGNGAEVAAPPLPDEVFISENPVGELQRASPPLREEFVDQVGSVVVDPNSLISTLPVLSNRSEARRIVADAIPPRLDQRDVWGKVELLIWVNPEGAVELPQIDRSSGFPELDRAALKAVRSFEFEPATRLGVAVGTWVRFPIGFRPESARVLLDAEAETMRNSRNN